MDPKAMESGREEYAAFELISSEKWWRDRYNFLMKHGYQLRPRFRPGWIPTWVRKKKDPLFCEDGHMNLVRVLCSLS